MNTDSGAHDATSEDTVAYETMQSEVSTMMKGFSAWQRAIEIRAIVQEYKAHIPSRVHRIMVLTRELEGCLCNPADAEAWLARK